MSSRASTDMCETGEDHVDRRADPWRGLLRSTPDGRRGRMLATLLTTSSIREFRAEQLRPDLNRALTATLIMCAANAAREPVEQVLAGVLSEHDETVLAAEGDVCGE